MQNQIIAALACTAVVVVATGERPKKADSWTCAQTAVAMDCRMAPVNKTYIHTLQIETRIERGAWASHRDGLNGLDLRDGSCVEHAAHFANFPLSR